MLSTDTLPHILGDPLDHLETKLMGLTEYMD